MKVIALVGLCGAGKSIVSDLFQKKGFFLVYFGGITMEELNRRGLEVNEKNERFVREDLRKIHGMAAFAKLNIEKIRSGLKTSPVVADGLYSWEEYKVLKEAFGDDLVVVGVQSSPATRYKRLSERDVRPMTFDEAKSRDYSEIENINKAGPIAIADYTIINEDDLETLHGHFDYVYKKIMGE